MCQPAQSPDLNVLDLGYFAAIQSLQQKKRTTTLEELVVAVQGSFVELSRETLVNVFPTWCACMEKIMLHAGDNQNKIPHTQKARFRRTGDGLPSEYTCSQEAVTITGLVQLERKDPA